MRSVLVIDASSTIGVAVERILARLPVEVATASTGLAGIAAMLDRRPDLVLCDQVLPDRDGLSLLRFVRNHPMLKATPFFLVSGAVDDDVERAALAAGCNAIVRKPVAAETLVELVEGALGGPQDAAPSRSARILVVDDSTSVRIAVERILARNGYLTTSVASGEAALAALEKDVFDLVICDLVMPGLDGIGVLRAVKDSERHRSTPVLLISGLGDAELVERARGAGCDDLVAKPFSPETLLPRVERLVARAGQAGTAPAAMQAVPAVAKTDLPAEIEAPVEALPAPPPAVPSTRVPQPVTGREREATRVLGSVPGADWVLLSDADGSFLDSEGRVPEETAAEAMKLAAPLAALGASDAKGTLRSAILQYESGFLVLFCLRSGRFLLVSLVDARQLGLLRLVVEKRLPHLFADRGPEG